ncbi:AAA family ATPase [Spirosoma daeguense]
MNNLGQFNLIVGDNNVGKTSVLEALTFSPNIIELAHNFLFVALSRYKYNFSDSLINKQEVPNTEFWNYLFKERLKSINIKINYNEKYSINLLSQDQLSDKDKEFIKNNIFPNLANKWIKLNSQKDSTDNFNIISAYFENINLNIEHYCPFIDANTNYTHSLVDIFYEHFNSNKESRKELEKNLRMFISDLEEIRTHKFHANQEALALTLINSNEIFPITQYGDGTLKVLRLIMEIFITKNNRLMVDEIGSGIHFTRLKDYWKTVIQLCSKYNVQLFATTHSLECQRAFVEALQSEEMKQYQADARNITLLENKKSEVKAFTYDFDQFEYSLSVGVNTRGGQL